MPFNTFNLSNSALSDVEPNTLQNIYPVGTLLVNEDGTAYRARETYPDKDGNSVQSYSELALNGANGATHELPEGVRVVWFPSEED